MNPVDDYDQESRSDDAGFEPFVLFGVLLQAALWPADPPAR